MNDENCWLSADKKQEGLTSADLPCEDGVCRHKPENMKRLRGRDPGLPCPRFLALSRDKELIAQAERRFDYRYPERAREHIVQSGILDKVYWPIQVDNVERVARDEPPVEK